MSVDYDKISQTYDHVRQADAELVTQFLRYIETVQSPKVLEVGCGTGNYLDAFQHMIEGEFYGVEPSAGMRQKASAKNAAITVYAGDACHIPCESAMFDLVYMVDVIHHVTDYVQMFAELRRVLKPNGKLCIVTQSHEQIAKRPIAQFFPDTVAVDQSRYPDIDDIATYAQGFDLLATVAYKEAEPVVLGRDFFELVQHKGYSMLHLISDAAYEQGLVQLEQSLSMGTIDALGAGYTLVWLSPQR
jgi:SAM-dependent methyltransferase